ncbi:O-antigen ligase family protein [Paenibacillus septentrionalis]|uniref:O-antigen ligase family protein n=1 Tax=Paenibacillus septentrionalis TaxID=429342 RepID=A0ABW1V7S0_9BACL
MKIREEKYYLTYFIPLYLLLLLPFPSSLVGYSVALWINDFILMGYLIFLIVTKKFKVPRKKMTIVWLCLLVILNIVGIINSIIRGNISSLRVLSELVRTFEFFLIYIYFINLFRILKENRATIENVIKSNLIIVSSCVFFISFIELFNFPLKELLRNLYEMGKSGNIYQHYNRIVGTLRNPNFFGIWLAITIVFFYTVNLKIIWRLVLLVIPLIYLFFTGSRTSWVLAVVSLAIVVLIQLFLKKGKKIYSIAIIGLVTLTFVIIYTNYETLFYSVRFNWNLTDILTLGGRTEIWGMYLEEIKRNIIFGVGINKGDDIVFDNLFLQYMYFYGVFGVIFLLLFFCRNLGSNIKLLLLRKKDNLLIFVLGMQLIFIFSSFTIQIFDVLQITFFYIMGLAYLDYLRLYERDEHIHN